MSSGPRLDHRPPRTWRSRHLFGALGLRPAAAQHSEPEARLLKQWAAGARTVVELGVAEGGSAAELRSVMAADGHLYLVDPYEPGRLGISVALIVARRTVRRVEGPHVTWIRARSDEAAAGWAGAIDFLFIDADHSYERASSDWRLWTPFVGQGGRVALHDSVMFPGGWTEPSTGPVRLLREIMDREPDWELVGQADSTTVLRRRGGAPHTSLTAPRSASRTSTGAGHLRILRVADVPRSMTAGMSGYMLSSGDEIERRGHRVTFWFRDELAPRLTTPGVRRLLVPWLIAANVVRAAWRGEEYDVVEIHEPSCAPYALLARLLPSRLGVCAAMSYGLEDRGWQARLAYERRHGRKPPLRSRILVPLTLLSQARAGLRLAGTVLVPSSLDRDHLVEHVGVPPERVVCAFTGVAKQLFALEREARPEARVLFLGSWIERKGTVELIDAWRRLAPQRPSARLTLAGVGDPEPVRTATAAVPAIDVIGTVSRTDMPRLLARHDVFVLPSWFEGLPLSMLEAASAGLACVVSGVCGNLDVFAPDDPGRDGAILVAPGDSDALHRALLTLVDDSALREELGARARERARDFSWAHCAEQILSAYREAIGARRPPWLLAEPPVLAERG